MCARGLTTAIERIPPIPHDQWLRRRNQVLDQGAQLGWCHRLEQHRMPTRLGLAHRFGGRVAADEGGWYLCPGDLAQALDDLDAGLLTRQAIVAKQGIG